MTKKVQTEDKEIIDNSNNSMNLGEIGTIRNILVGEQMTEFELRFKELEEQMANFRGEMLLKIQESDKTSTSAMGDLEKVFEKKLAEFEAILDQNRNLFDSLQKDRSEDREVIGKLLIDFGNKLLQE